MVLGVSLATLLQIADTAAYIQSLVQVFEEYDYHFSNAAVQSMKRLQASMGGDADDDEQDKVRSRLRKHYRFLQTPCAKFALDPRQVVITLCDVLSCTYRRFMDPVCASKPALFQAFLKIDQQLASTFIGHQGSNITQIAANIVNKEIGGVEDIFRSISQAGGLQLQAS